MIVADVDVMLLYAASDESVVDTRLGEPDS
jgi:hypothetical protein